MMTQFSLEGGNSSDHEEPYDQPEGWANDWCPEEDGEFHELGGVKTQ
jgi:hypothetical protein